MSEQDRINGRRGGEVGGPARAEALTPAERKEIAAKGGRAGGEGRSSRRCGSVDSSSYLLICR